MHCFTLDCVFFGLCCCCFFYLQSRMLVVNCISTSWMMFFTCWCLFGIVLLFLLFATANAHSQTNIRWLDSDALCVDGTQIGVFENTNSISFSCFLRKDDKKKHVFSLHSLFDCYFTLRLIFQCTLLLKKFPQSCSPVEQP